MGQVDTQLRKLESATYSVVVDWETFKEITARDESVRQEKRRILDESINSTDENEIREALAALDKTLELTAILCKIPGVKDAKYYQNEIHITVAGGYDTEDTWKAIQSAANIYAWGG